MSSLQSNLGVIAAWLEQERRGRLETKLAGTGVVVEPKQGLRDGGLEVGVLEGYAAGWGVDVVNDRFVPGCWSKSIAEHRARGARPVRLKYLHEPQAIIGSVPISSVVEDSRGLRISAEVALGTQLGLEVWRLAKLNALSDFSVGFVASKVRFANGVRLIEEAILVEISVVDEPAQRDARITSVKGRATREQVSMARILEDLRAARAAVR